MSRYGKLVFGLLVALFILSADLRVDADTDLSPPEPPPPCSYNPRVWCDYMPIVGGYE